VGSNRLMARTDRSLQVSTSLHRSLQVSTGLRGQKIKKIIQKFVGQGSPDLSGPLVTRSRPAPIPTSGFLIGVAVGGGERASSRKHNLQRVGSSRLMARTDRSIQVYTGLFRAKRTKKMKKLIQQIARQGSPDSCIGAARLPSSYGVAAPRLDRGAGRLFGVRRLVGALPFPLHPQPSVPLHALRSPLCAGLPTAHIPRPKASELV
jgi:hypothetical protein